MEVTHAVYNMGCLSVEHFAYRGIGSVDGTGRAGVHQTHRRSVKRSLDMLSYALALAVVMLTVFYMWKKRKGQK